MYDDKHVLEVQRSNALILALFNICLWGNVKALAHLAPINL